MKAAAPCGKPHQQTTRGTEGQRVFGKGSVKASGARGTRSTPVATPLLTPAPLRLTSAAAKRGIAPAFRGPDVLKGP